MYRLDATKFELQTVHYLNSFLRQKPVTACPALLSRSRNLKRVPPTSPLKTGAPLLNLHFTKAWPCQSSAAANSYFLSRSHILFLSEPKWRDVSFLLICIHECMPRTTVVTKSSLKHIRHCQMTITKWRACAEFTACGVFLDWILD